MSDQKESYEELEKQLKPFSVVLHKIPNEEFIKLKVVSDPHRIKDEVLIEAICDNIEDEEEEEPEEEVEIDLTEVETKANTDLNEDMRVFSCFFCKKTSIGYDQSFIHFQLHIDYFPIQCSLCDEAITDVNTFTKHCRKFHPQLEKAVYIRKYNSNCFEWINNFLITKETESFKDNPQKYCPACDWLHLSAPDVNNPNDSTQPLKPLQILRHIHQHIRYEPYSCNMCKEKGQEFRVHVLDSEVRKHILSEHKELTVNDAPFWKFFNKRFTIASLDKFIVHYLGIFGLKYPKKRNKRKSKTETQIIKKTNENSHITSFVAQKSGAIKPIVKQIPVENKPITLQNLMVRTINPPILNTNTLNTLKNAFPIQLNINQMESPLLLFPSNDKINLNPIPVESTDIGIVCIDPKTIEIEDRLFKYICVFCVEEKVFYSKTEACVHYAIHFDYNPVICLLCEKQCIDLSVLIHHYNKEHSDYKNDLFHYIKEDEKIEKWINEFLDHQKTHLFAGNVSALLGDFCFVCNKLFKCDNGIKLTLENSVNTTRDHIHQHLYYYPFKCLICYNGGRDVRFTSLNENSLKHLSTFHGLNTNDKKIAKTYSKLIVKMDEILNLEKFIDNKLFPKRQQITETPLILNLKRKLEEIEAENRKGVQMPAPNVATISPLTNLLKTPIPRLTNNIMYCRSPTQNQITHSNEKIILVSNSVPKPKVNGMNSNQFISRITPVKQHVLIPSKNTYIEPFLLCFHCHTKVSNTSELESHHQSKHPRLTIASYAPTKRDLLGSVNGH